MSAVRERLSVKPQPPRASRAPFGLSAGEIIAALLTLTLFSVALFYYLTTLGPDRNRLQTAESGLNRLETELIKTRAEANTPPQVDTSVEAIESLERFKSKHLMPISPGEIALYRDINALAGKHKVILTSGIEMKREVIAPGEEDKESRSKDDPLASIYPHTVVNFIVAGQYESLRAFLNELERNQQFVIINTVSLDSVEELEGEGGSRGSGSQQSGLALSIEMTAYFQP